MFGLTFHLHYHILFYLINQIDKKQINYVEIGVFYGRSLLSNCAVNLITKNNFKPKSCGLAHSSATFRCDVITNNYFTTHDESKVRYVSDVIMWLMLIIF